MTTLTTRESGADIEFTYESLPREAAEVARAAAGRIRASQRRVRAESLAIGNELLRVKAAMPHGEFGRWLDFEFNWSERSARNFMVAAAWIDTLSAAESAMIADLPATAICQLAAPSTPEPVRLEVLKLAADGKAPSVAAIRERVAAFRAGQSSAEPSAQAAEAAEKPSPVHPVIAALSVLAEHLPSLRHNAEFAATVPRLLICQSDQMAGWLRDLRKCYDEDKKRREWEKLRTEGLRFPIGPAKPVEPSITKIRVEVKSKTMGEYIAEIGRKQHETKPAPIAEAAVDPAASTTPQAEPLPPAPALPTEPEAPTPTVSPPAEERFDPTPPSNTERLRAALKAADGVTLIDAKKGTPTRDVALFQRADGRLTLPRGEETAAVTITDVPAGTSDAALFDRLATLTISAVKTIAFATIEQAPPRSLICGAPSFWFKFGGLIVPATSGMDVINRARVAYTLARTRGELSSEDRQAMVVWLRYKTKELKNKEFSRGLFEERHSSPAATDREALSPPARILEDLDLEPATKQPEPQHTAKQSVAQKGRASASRSRRKETLH